MNLPGMTAAPSPARPDSNLDAERDASRRAHACVERWSAACQPAFQVQAMNVLQRPAQGNVVFECVLASRAGRRTVIAKCLPARGFALAAQRTVAAHRVAQAASPLALRVPGVLHVDPALRVLVLEEARGVVLAGLSANDPTHLARCLERTAQALRELHRFPANALAELGGLPARASTAGLAPIELHMAELMRPHPDELAALLAPSAPRVAQRLRTLVERLRQASADYPLEASCIVHRDFHPRQIFVSADRVDVIDWDLCGVGDSALDLASLHLHIDLRWPGVAERLHDAVTLGYGYDALRVHQRMSLFLAFHHLRRACKAWRRAGAGDRTSTLLAPWIAGANAHLDDHLAGHAVTRSRAPGGAARSLSARPRAVQREYNS